MEEIYEDLRTWLKKNRNQKIFVLTGAGISAESGISTFRDKGGLWENHSITEVASPLAFQKNPSLVYEFYNMRRENVLLAQPNSAHTALADLSDALDSNFNLITQNVDDLHERGGVRSVLHMHGEILKARCLECSAVQEWKSKLDANSSCYHCSGKLRPHIVWYGEVPFYMDEIDNLIKETDLFISIGTSGTVYPAAAFSQMAKMCGAFTIEINYEKTSDLYDLNVIGKATEKVTEVVNVIKNNYNFWK